VQRRGGKGGRGGEERKGKMEVWRRGVERRRGKEREGETRHTNPSLLPALVLSAVCVCHRKSHPHCSAYIDLAFCLLWDDTMSISCQAAE